MAHRLEACLRDGPADAGKKGPPEKGTCRLCSAHLSYNHLAQNGRTHRGSFPCCSARLSCRPLRQNLFSSRQLQCIQVNLQMFPDILPSSPKDLLQEVSKCTNSSYFSLSYAKLKICSNVPMKFTLSNIFAILYLWHYTWSNIPSASNFFSKCEKQHHAAQLACFSSSPSYLLCL